MELFRILIFFGFIGLNQLNGQFFEDFSDQNLSVNPEWTGNLTDFIVNDNGALQLMAMEAGQSSLQTSFLASTAFQWDINFELGFSPSNSNRLHIHFLSDNADLDNSSGYYLRIGETGSNDALELIQATDGRTVASGIAGRVASGPFTMKVRILLIGGTTLEVSSQLNDEVGFTPEFSEDINFVEGDYFFGIQCLYTSTRVDEFTFNAIELASPTNDESPPRLLDIVESGPDVICLRFSETIDESLSREEVLISVGEEFIDDISFVGRDVKLNYDSGQDSGPVNISIMGISDASGNRVDTAAVLIRAVKLESGSVLINEILFDPVSGGDDFLELINTTDQFVDLKNLTIENNLNGQSEAINSSIILEPFGIIALTEDKAQLLDYYSSAEASAIVLQDLPSFPNGSGNVTIEKDGIVIDAFNYSDDLHNDLLDDSEGVSLERRTTDANASDIDLWTSASQASGFATPGLENSAAQFLGDTGTISLSGDSFSPNDDGDNDVLEITIQSGFESLGNIWIYDQSGNMIRQLESNILLGAEDKINWDGDLEDGNRAPIGIYIIRVEVFNTSGQVLKLKKAVALVDFIN